MTLSMLSRQTVDSGNKPVTLAKSGPSCNAVSYLIVCCSVIHNYLIGNKTNMSLSYTHITSIIAIYNIIGISDNNNS